MTYDLIIRNGTIVDGLGGSPYLGDVAVRDGVIKAVGAINGDTAEREIDATGLLVTPGFVDLHTHYDGQAIWSDRMTPSSHHGVTTAVMGNCGVGFAPCRAADHDVLVDVMSGVEDIPGAVMVDGLPWDWETSPAALTRMRALAKVAIETGAIGFASSRFAFHKTGSGDLIPTYGAAQDEIAA